MACLGPSPRKSCPNTAVATPESARAIATQLRLVLNNLAASSDAVIKNGPSSGVPALLLMGATECMRRFHGQQGHQG